MKKIVQKKYLDPKRHMKRLVRIVSFYALTQASVLTCVFVLFLCALMAFLVQQYQKQNYHSALRIFSQSFLPAVCCQRLRRKLNVVSDFTSVEDERGFSSSIKDVHAKIFQSIDFFSNFYCRQIMSYLCHKCKKNWGSPSSFQR